MKQHYIVSIFALVFLSQTIYAQEFNAYTQNIEGESVGIEMVAISGGVFMMGTNDKSRPQDEKPAHKVEVSDFWMGKFEINWDQYEAFVYRDIESENFSKTQLNSLGLDAVSGATQPYVDMSFNMGKGSSPAVNITQYAAMTFCKWLSAKTGVFYRLPTEAEWEYVCKTGTNSSNLDEVAWFAGNTNNKYEKTGKKQANKYGVYDLLGNASEWVLDQYSTSYYNASGKLNPWNKPKELYPRVARGGSWKDTDTKVCCTARQASKSAWKRRDPQIPKSNWWHTNAPFIGFRVVRPKVQPSANEIKKYWLEVIEDFGDH